MFTNNHLPIKRVPWQILLIVLCGGLAYSNTFHVPFVFDDYPNIVENRALESFSTLFNSITSSHAMKSRWFAQATFTFNKLLGGTNVTGFHIVNVLIHISTALAVYFLTKTMLSSSGEKSRQRYAIAPLLAALGFVLHPVQTQAVTYIVQRMTSLATLLYLIAVLLYAHVFQNTTPAATSHRLRNAAFYLLAIVSSLLAMSTKEISFTLPLTIALFDLFFLKGTVRQRIVRLFPFALGLALVLLFLVGIDKGFGVVTHGGGDDGSFPLPRAAYFYTECRVILTYMRLLILPVAQNLDYVYPVYTSLLQPQVCASLALIIVLLGCGVYFYKTSRKETCQNQALWRIAGFSLFWFFITLSIESGFVPLLDTIFEHRLYLPSVGFFIALALVVAELQQRVVTRKTFVTIVAVFVLIISGYATYQRNSIWQDRATLWTDVVKKAPNNSRALTNLGKYYVDTLDPNTAISLLEHAITLAPGNSRTHYTLGLAYTQRGDTERALRHYVMTTQLSPKKPKGWEDAGRLLLEKGNYREATIFLRRALEIDPSAFSAREKAWLMGTR
jgi:hypothetical protein